MDPFAPLPTPPYYAVIFASRRSASERGYREMAERLARLAARQPGCLGMETARDPVGFGITVSYWRDRESIRAWRDNAIHLMAQKLGKTRWYEHFSLRIALVEHAYEGPRTA